MVLSNIASILLWILAHVFFIRHALFIELIIEKIDFSKVLMDIMLCFMLYAGAFHTNFEAIKKEKKSIAILSVLGTFISTFLIGGLLYGFTILINYPIDFIICLLFGSLISPTDPIAVLGILNNTRVDDRLKTNIVGESLFNDGVGIVIFTTILAVIQTGSSEFSLSHTLIFFLQEAIGGIIFGVVLGYLAFKLLKSIDHYQTELLITISVVMGGYVMASLLHISGPLAMVVAGLITGGDQVRREAMSNITETYLDKFWEMVDELLNALLFLLIGLRISVLEYKPEYLLLGLAAIVIVLLSRYFSFISLSMLFKKKLNLTHKHQLFMVWSGLKGGLSFAMALSVSAMPEKQPIVFMTYIVVLFSILVQGLSIQKVAEKLTKG